ncbi:MAG: hypothetical protein ACUZ8E_18045 [Candidatus Anammoxibacter sp.]
MIELGKTYKDTITGFKGVCIGYVQYITGCNQVLLTPKVDETGKSVKSDWFDEQRVTESKAKKVVLDNGETPGFCEAAPIK